MEDSSHQSLSEQIACLALNTFDSLPPRCKPRQLPNGSREWTPLSAIILIKHNIHPSKLKTISLGTGTKSLPVSALPKCHGLILHDCHAEILAFRGFNYWLLCEMERMVHHNEYDSPWLERLYLNEKDSNPNPKPKPFRIRQHVTISLFSTEAPCGDASMELLIAAAKASGADTSPWPSPQVSSSRKLSPGEAVLPPGRGGFSDLGALRRKPARADAEVSMSMSCTDKISMKQFTGLINFPVDLLLERDERAYLKTMVVYDDQYDAAGYTRAFARGGRLQKALNADQKPAGFEPFFFDIEVLPKDFRRFAYERFRSTSEQNLKNKVTNTSAVWVAGDPARKGSDIVEVLVNGVKQGYKQFDDKPKKGSVLCRYGMIRKALALHDALQQSKPIAENMDFSTVKMYSELKDLPYRHSRKALKAWLLEKMGDWPKVAGDDLCIDLENPNRNSISSYMVSFPDFAGFPLTSSRFSPIAAVLE